MTAPLDSEDRCAWCDAPVAAGRSFCNQDHYHQWQRTTAAEDREERAARRRQREAVQALKRAVPPHRRPAMQARIKAAAEEGGPALVQLVLSILEGRDKP